MDDEGSREAGCRARPPVGDAHLRRALLRRRRPTRSSAATWRRGRPACRVAFDLPTQTGYDPDHELAAGEVGRVGVPVAHLGDMRALFDGIPLADVNTSMTINAPAMWLLALYVHGRRGAGRRARRAAPAPRRTTSSRSTCPGGRTSSRRRPSLRLTADIIAWTVREMPKWNPVNICSYHLQEAGATPVQEVGFALATAVAVLDAVRDSGQVPAERMGDVVQRISFFVNAGVRFVEEIAQDARVRRALGRDHRATGTASPTPRQRRFRYGVQVNSLGLTEAQPENNVQRIVLEMLGVTLLPRRPGPRRAAAGLERGARPAAALGPAVVAAHAAGPRVRVGPARVPRPVRRLARDRPRWSTASSTGARAELEKVLEMGGVVAAVGDRLPQERAGRLARRPAPTDGVRRRRGGRRQPVHRDRAVPADRGRGREPSSRSTPRWRRPPSTSVREWRAGRDAGGGRRGARAGSARTPRPRRT